MALWAPRQLFVWELNYSNPRSVYPKVIQSEQPRHPDRNRDETFLFDLSPSGVCLDDAETSLPIQEPLKLLLER